jgi:hypothetical protein
VWSQILLLLTIPAAIYFSLSRINPERKDAKAVSAILLIVLFVNEVMIVSGAETHEIISGYLVISMNALMLILLLIGIHWLRPGYARYPYLFVYFPLIIVLSYPLIDGTEVLVNIILMIIQGGSLLVFASLYAAHFSTFKRNWLAVISVISFLAAYIVFWYLPESVNITLWMWQPLIVMGMISASLTFPNLLSEKLTSEKPNGY